MLKRIVTALLCFGFAGLVSAEFLAPNALTDLGNGSLAVSLKKGKRIAIFSPEKKAITHVIPLQSEPNDVLSTPNYIFVAVGGPDGKILVYTKAFVLVREISAGHTPIALHISPDESTLYWSSRFHNRINRMDLKAWSVISETGGREPFALSLTRDGTRLFVANLIPGGRSDSDFVAATVDVRKAADLSLIASISLPNGSQSLRSMTMSPDGKLAAVTHILSRYQIPTTQIDRGWINTNAVSFIRTDSPVVECTILLDDVDAGFANPWGISFSPDGSKLFVVASGTHDVSVIDYAKMMEKVKNNQGGDRLSLLNGIRTRVPLTVNGPRCMVISGGNLWVAGQFTDDLAVMDMNTQKVQNYALGGSGATTPQELGERYFSDASLCFQDWQSCISCHPDARVDALNWDLLNDGLGNPKNTRSMLMSHQTAPVMWLGVRKNAEVAVKAGFKHIQFAAVPPETAAAVDSYLSDMSPIPGPALDPSKPEMIKQKENAKCIKCHGAHNQRGSLTDSARRGKAIFKGKGGCVACHPHPLFTTAKMYNPGLGTGVDTGKSFKIPSLIELWRTAPYLHDGRAETIREVITTYNVGDKRGKTSTLSADELNDLIQYLLSL